VRGQQVMIDRDIAELYGVETKRLNEQVKRNIERFPKEFCFQLSVVELQDLMSQTTALPFDNRSRSQFATLNKGRGSNIKYLPYAFTLFVSVGPGPSDTHYCCKSHWAKNWSYTVNIPNSCVMKSFSSSPLTAP
jgi:hypothetical protein